MKLIKYIVFFVSLISAFHACKEDERLVSDQSLTRGSVAVEAELSVAGKELITKTLSWNGVEVSGVIHNQEGVEVSEYGILYSTVNQFSIGEATKLKGDNLSSLQGFSADHFSVKLNGLRDMTTYYYRFYAKSAAGISYSQLSEECSFTTKPNYRVPELSILSESEVLNPIIECAIDHNGNYDVTECGIYFGRDPKEMRKIAASDLKMTGVKGTYTIDLTGEGLIINDIFYVKAYATNQAGEGTADLFEMKIARPKEYPVVHVEGIQVLSRTTVKCVVKVDNAGYGSVQEYGYYMNGKKISVGNMVLNTGDTFEFEVDGLVMGVENFLYPYAINPDGESAELDPTSFMSGIPGKNEGDKYLVYLELPAIEKDGVKYIFLDRNLGAKAAYGTGEAPEVATDAGWCIQWGRDCDGHQLWTSAVTTLNGGSSVYPLAAEYQGKFIKSNNYVWVDKYCEPSPETFWTMLEDGGITNPCPEGYRVPTKDEMSIFWANKATMKIASATVFRAASDGTKRTNNAFWWTSTYDKTNAKVAATQMQVTTGALSVNSSTGQGSFVRCIRIEK